MAKKVIDTFSGNPNGFFTNVQQGSTFKRIGKKYYLNGQLIQNLTPSSTHILSYPIGEEWVFLGGVWKNFSKNVFAQDKSDREEVYVSVGDDMLLVDDCGKFLFFY